MRWMVAAALVAAVSCGIVLGVDGVRSQSAPSGPFGDDVTFDAEIIVPADEFPGPNGLASAIAFTPDGRMFYNERCGRTRVVTAEGDLLPTPFVDLTDVVRCHQDYALVGLAIDPNFEVNHYVYLFYMIKVSEDPRVSKPVLTRYTEVDNIGTNPTPILDDLPKSDPDVPTSVSQHGSNNIRFGPDGKLYVSLGDLARHLEDFAQDLSVPAGKILRINPDGSAPTDNPFFGVASGDIDERIYAYGLRNSFDFTFHPDDGRIYATENGPNKCDELNLIEPAGNYGWPRPYEGLGPWVEWDDPFESVSADSCNTPESDDTEAMHLFRFYDYTNPADNNSTSAPTGIVFIDGDQYPVFGDSLLVCEFRTQNLRVLMLDEDHDEVVAEPVIFPPDGEPQDKRPCAIAIAIAPDGEIYYSGLPDEETGYGGIMRLVIGSGPTQQEWGDLDCSGAAGITDALKTFQFAAESAIDQEASCYPPGQDVEVIGGSPHTWGDVDCDGDVDAQDGLWIMLYVAALTPEPPDGCPAIGSTVTVDT